MRAIRSGYGTDRDRLMRALASYESAFGPLPGIASLEARAALVEQLIDSEQRIIYFGRLQSRLLDPVSAEPNNESFDPLRAAIINRDKGNFDEAVWLTYLFVHFGHHRAAGWRYVRDVYGRLGQGGRWGWPEVSADPTLFRYWLADNLNEIQRPGPRGFGNHRKYESLNAWEATGTGAAIESYVDWVLEGFADHREHFDAFGSLTPQQRFAALYDDLRPVRRFGRIARFDYLTTLGRLNLLDATPPHSYLIGSTGPLAGARLLLTDGSGFLTAADAQIELSRLSTFTSIAPDILEDAVCNWQKSPTLYVRFSG